MTTHIEYTYEQLVELTTALLEYDGYNTKADYRSTEMWLKFYIGNHLTQCTIDVPKALITDEECENLIALMSKVQVLKAKELTVRIHQSIRKGIDVMNSYHAIPDRTPSGIAESEKRNERMRGHTKTTSNTKPLQKLIMSDTPSELVELAPIDQCDIDGIEEAIGETRKEQGLPALTPLPTLTPLPALTPLEIRANNIVKVTFEKKPIDNPKTTWDNRHKAIKKFDRKKFEALYNKA